MGEDVLWLGDCLHAPNPDRFELLYVDPPFGPVGEDTYYGVGADLPEYLEYLSKRILRFCAGRTDFNLVVHLDPKFSHYVKVALDKALGRANFRNEIIWGWSGPSVAQRHLPRKHGVLLWWGLGDYPFNPIRVPYQPGLSVGGSSSWDPGAEVQEYLERGKLIEDWWVDIPPLIRNEAEKRGYPTQKPLRLLERVVGMLSNPGGLVFDPMMGSGTTGVPALRAGRKFQGCDANPAAVELTRQALRGHPATVLVLLREGSLQPQG
jgi:hypothetical protein